MWAEGVGRGGGQEGHLGGAVEVHCEGLCARAAVAQPASHQLVRPRMVHILEELHAWLGAGVGLGLRFSKSCMPD